MDSWEALDVDDSDLLLLTKPSSSSTLLPCKRRSLQQQSICNQPGPTTITTNNSNEFSLSLEPCSQLSRHSHSQSQPPSTQIEEISKGSPLTTSNRVIPGPAGALQAAMHRRALSKRNTRDAEEEEEEEEDISTQEYLKRVQEVAEGEDEDFKMNPWLCAMEFLDGNDGGNLVSRSSLRSINSSRSTDRLPQVVAVVKSCVPNGFGDLIVTLKDPTGTIGASIHRNVVMQSDFGKDITVGSVLILQKVVVFSPSRSVCNLNITRRNVVKVIAKDSGPPTRHNRASTVANIHSGTELGETRLLMVEKAATSASRDAAEGIVDEEVAGEVKEKALVDYSDRQCEEAGNGGKIFWGNSSSNGYHYASSIAAKLRSSECESTRPTEAVKQRQHLISKATLPEWTDEQLDELFADDTFLF